MYTEDAGLEIITDGSRIRPSRYGRAKRKCWSQIALTGMAEKRFPGPCS